MRKGLAVLCLLGFVALVGFPGVAAAEKTVFIKNTTTGPVKVYIAFGADSQVTMKNVGFPCTFFNTEPRGLNCGFDLPAGQQKQIGQKGQIIGMSVGFNKAPGCGVTLGEIFANKTGPGAEAIDISVVDGFNEKIVIQYDHPSDKTASFKIGPPCPFDTMRAAKGIGPVVVAIRNRG